MSEAITSKLFKRGRDFLKVEYPVICGAMTWVSNPELVAAVSNAGGLGCLAGGNMQAEGLRKIIDETRSRTDKPFGINLITITPVYREQLKMLEKINPDIVVFAGGIPRSGEIEMMKNTGAKTMCFAANLTVGRRMIEHGADALIIEGSEAGGHLGYLSLSVLLQEVLFNINDVPVFAGGGIATGRMCAHLFLMGAAGVQLGTRFAVSKESPAHDEFKKKYLRAKSRDAVASAQFDSRLPVSPVRAIKNKGTEEFARLQIQLIEKLDKGEIGRDEAALKLEEFWMGGLRAAVIDGDTAAGSLMAGQSVGLVDSVMPAKEIIDELVCDIEKELKRVRDILDE